MDIEMLFSGKGIIRGLLCFPAKYETWIISP